MVSSILTLHFSSSMLRKLQDTLDQIHLNCLQRGHIWILKPKTCLLSEGESQSDEVKKSIFIDLSNFWCQAKKILQKVI